MNNNIAPKQEYLSLSPKSLYEPDPLMTWPSESSMSATNPVIINNDNNVNNDFNMPFISDADFWPMEVAPTQQNPNLIDSLIYNSMPSNMDAQQYQPMFPNQMQPQQQHQFQQSQPQQQQPHQQFIFPPTPPVNPTNFINNNLNMYPQPSNVSSREITPPSTNGSSPVSQMSTTPPLSYHNYFPMTNQALVNQPMVNQAMVNQPVSQPKSAANRRKSTGSARTYRRRASSHPSVASVVSLTAHEPVATMVNGIEFIKFLYSHDRLVKEYTVCTDIGKVDVDQLPLDFRVQNAIYPRANVPREEYDGNRWNYETSCNRLGWEICWLNQEELCGRRGLIQRAVDSYRNRHAEMRSRRVARQEKVANGTLRKRRAKKAVSAIL